jgi:hypothetical protein
MIIIQKSSKSEMKYYEAILSRPLEHLHHCYQHLKERCDSKLEIAYALCLLDKVSINVIPEIDGDWIWICEPWNSSPTGSGSSAAWLECQCRTHEEVWDFALWQAYDNGASQCDSYLHLLIDIDGFGSHQGRRDYDWQKVKHARDNAIKLPEENFKSIDDMAEVALYCGTWHLHDYEDQFFDGSINNFNNGKDIYSV